MIRRRLTCAIAAVGHTAAALVVAVLAVAIVASTPALAQTPPPAQTPQGLVAAAFYKAARAGDVVALKNVLTEKSAKALDGPNAKMLVDALKGQYQGVVTVMKVTVAGATAKVDSELKAGTRAIPDSLKLVLVGKEWRVDKS